MPIGRTCHSRQQIQARKIKQQTEKLDVSGSGGISGKSEESGCGFTDRIFDYGTKPAAFTSRCRQTRQDYIFGNERKNEQCDQAPQQFFVVELSKKVVPKRPCEAECYHPKWQSGFGQHGIENLCSCGKDGCKYDTIGNVVRRREIIRKPAFDRNHPAANEQNQCY